MYMAVNLHFAQYNGFGPSLGIFLGVTEGGSWLVGYYV